MSRIDEITEGLARVKSEFKSGELTEKKELPPLWNHQIRGIERAEHQDYFGFFFEVGCIAGHTKIKINRNGVSRSYTIEDLYRRFNNIELPLNANPWKKNSPTYVRSWNGKYIGLNKIKKVVRSGEKQVFDLLTKQDGYWIRATADHEILTQRGFVQLKDIIPGKDFVAIDDLIRHKKKESKLKIKSKKPRYKRRHVGKFHPYARTTYGPRGEKIRIVDTHRLVYEASLNNISIESFIARTYKQNRLKFIDPKKFHIHHINHDSYDNRIENLKCLTAKEHLKHHGSYTHFGHGELNYRLVKKIVPRGIEMTYDIACEAPHHNFVANNIVIHNCGKTRALIETLESKYEFHGSVLKTLILTPLIVVENFKREVDKFGRLSSGKARALLGTRGQKLEILKEVSKTSRTPILITNYETLINKEILQAIKYWTPEIVVADELHKLKNPTSLRAKNCQALSDRAKYRFGLSGTPVLNSEMDLFSQIRFLDHGKALGSNFFIFRQQYFYDVNASRRNTGSYFPMWKPRVHCIDQLKAKIAPFTMTVKKEDALDLPPLVYKEVILSMDGEQKRCYESMKKDFIAFIKDKCATADLAITKSLRLLQITSGFIKLEDGTEKEFDDNPKAKATENLLEDITPTSKVIVWCSFKKNYETVQRICEKLNISYAMLHGETKNRQEEVDKFQNDDACRVMIANASSGGIGINLTAASYALYYSKNFSLGDDIQSMARCYRGGSEIHASITRIDLICDNSIDELVHKVLKEKLALAETVMTNAEVYMKLRNSLNV